MTKNSVGKKAQYLGLVITLVVMTFTFLTLIAQLANAAVTPLSFSVVPPVQFPPSDFTITGVRASVLYGRHRDLYGVDLGLGGNITDGNFVGVGIAGLFNATRGSTTILGLQFAGLSNINTEKTTVVGLQLTAGLNYNSAQSSVTGLQLGLIGNYSPFTNVYGAQVGLYNSANEVYGVQIGLVNVASNLHGVQIGLANFNDKGLFRVSPFLNVGW